MRKSGIPQRKSGIPQWKCGISADYSGKQWNLCGIPLFRSGKREILDPKQRKSLASENSNYFKNPELQLSENKRIIFGNLQTNTYLVFRQYNVFFVEIFNSAF